MPPVQPHLYMEEQAPFLVADDYEVLDAYFTELGAMVIYEREDELWAHFPDTDPMPFLTRIGHELQQRRLRDTNTMATIVNRIIDALASQDEGLREVIASAKASDDATYELQWRRQEERQRIRALVQSLNRGDLEALTGKHRFGRDDLTDAAYRNESVKQAVVEKAYRDEQFQAQWWRWFDRLGIPRPTLKQEVLPPLDSFVLYTGQETTLLIQSAANGKSGKDWRNDESSDKRIYEPQNARYRVELLRAHSPEDTSCSWEKLQDLTSDQDLDFAFALSYIAGRLAAPPDARQPQILRGKIDLNYMIKAAGWLKEGPDKARRNELRWRMWRLIVYGANAIVIGERSVPYFEDKTRRPLSTMISASPWKIVDRYPRDNATKTAPLWVELELAPQWAPLLSHPDLAQFLPSGQLLAQIAPHQVGTDWARTIGLTLAVLWRSNVQKTLAHQRRLTRRELLTHFTPKTQNVIELLASGRPKRAVEYYISALKLLHEEGFISQEGDCGKDINLMLEPYQNETGNKRPIQGWGEKWLNDACGLYPSGEWLAKLKEISKNKPTSKPKNSKRKKAK